jgi:hypothetical protein
MLYSNKYSLSIIHLERRTVLRPGLAMIVNPRRRNGRGRDGCSSHPPHRSVRAELPHTALAKSFGLKSLFRVRVQHFELRQEAISKLAKTAPRLQKSVENLPVFTIKERQSLPVINHYHIVFNTYSVFINWKKPMLIVVNSGRFLTLTTPLPAVGHAPSSAENARFWGHSSN